MKLPENRPDCDSDTMYCPVVSKPRDPLYRRRHSPRVPECHPHYRTVPNNSSNPHFSGRTIRRWKAARKRHRSHRHPYNQRARPCRPGHQIAQLSHRRNFFESTIPKRQAGIPRCRLSRHRHERHADRSGGGHGAASHLRKFPIPARFQAPPIPASLSGTDHATTISEITAGAAPAGMARVRDRPDTRCTHG